MVLIYIIKSGVSMMNKIKFKSKKNLYVCIIIFLLIAVFFFFKIKKSQPIIIGLSAQLTGKQAELGVQERNGALLAVEKINSQGGIQGRKISLIINDDLGIKEVAKSGDNELIKKGAVAIIGHSTTAQTMEGIKAANANHVVMIGPTISTPELSGINDYFFRVYPSFKKSSKNLARYANKKSGITRLAIIYDNNNMEYSRTYSKVFAKKFTLLGGTITDEISYSSFTPTDYYPLLLKLKESKAEGLLIVASDVDTALITQRARLMGWQVPVFTSGWAQTEALIDNGGKAVEGMILEHIYTVDNKTPAFVDFESRYKTRFGIEPSFGAAFSYEATLVLAEALKKTNGNKDGLKDALLNIHDFKGIMNTFSFDKYGDVERPCYLSTINNGKFLIVNKLDKNNLEDSN